MTYKKEGTQVTLGMTVEEYSFLLLLLGSALGHFVITDPRLFKEAAKFIIAMNADNPNFSE